MLQTVLHIAVVLAILAGTVFSIVGVLGLIRLPDVYTRLHATGKVSVFGLLFLLIAAMLLGHAPVGKAILLIVFLVIAGPTLSHAVGAAAYQLGIPLKLVERNDLSEALPAGDDPVSNRKKSPKSDRESKGAQEKRTVT
ncbi:MAG: monovalent cation/H(+) antiporter subunit G [Phycisphaeraceae bacterium]|nr:monovalent cation/H(+) antiporter subunit G [Phycisphaeraceae bacterium]